MALKNKLTATAALLAAPTLSEVWHMPTSAIRRRS